MHLGDRLYKGPTQVFYPTPRGVPGSQAIRHPRDRADRRQRVGNLYRFPKPMGRNSQAGVSKSATASSPSTRKRTVRVRRAKSEYRNQVRAFLAPKSSPKLQHIVIRAANSLPARQRYLVGHIHRYYRFGACPCKCLNHLAPM